jgi:hypothetical protein
MDAPKRAYDPRIHPLGENGFTKIDGLQRLCACAGVSRAGEAVGYY